MWRSTNSNSDAGVLDRQWSFNADAVQLDLRELTEEEPAPSSSVPASRSSSSRRRDAQQQPEGLSLRQSDSGLTAAGAPESLLPLACCMLHAAAQPTQTIVAVSHAFIDAEPPVSAGERANVWRTISSDVYSSGSFAAAAPPRVPAAPPACPASEASDLSIPAEHLEQPQRQLSLQGSAALELGLDGPLVARDAAPEPQAQPVPPPPAPAASHAPSLPAIMQRHRSSVAGPRNLRHRRASHPANKPFEPLPHLQQHAADAGHAAMGMAGAMAGRRAAGASAGEAAEGGSFAAEEGRQEDFLAELEAQRARHAEQLRLESKVRAELESMISRIERHFKKQQAARKHAEEHLAQATAERDALHAQLEAERALQASLLQQAAQERAQVQEQCGAQLAALAAELEQTRQELAVRTEAMGMELAALRGSAGATARKLQEQAQEFASAGAYMRQLADALAGGSSSSMGSGLGVQSSPEFGSGSGSGSDASSPSGQQQALQFHRSPQQGAVKEASVASVGSPAKGSPTRGAAPDRQLPRLKKTQAVPGAQLRISGDAGGGGAAGTGGGRTTLPATKGGGGGSPGARLAGGHAVQRERSGGSAWNAAADRYSESRRDAGMVAHMAARWN